MCTELCTFLLCRALFGLRGARTHARTLHGDLLSRDACLVVQLTLSESDRNRRDETEEEEEVKSGRVCVFRQEET